MTRRLLAYLPAVVWVAFVLFVGGQSAVDGPTLPPLGDKVAHVLLYGVLGVLAARGWVRAGRRPARLWLFCAVLLIGGLDEWRQREIATRSAEVADWMADGMGALVGFAVARRLIERKREGDGSTDE